MKHTQNKWKYLTYYVFLHNIEIFYNNKLQV